MFCYAQDPSYLGGSLGEAHAESIIRVLRLAGRARAPVVGFIESGGARMQEGLAALGGYGRIFREHVALSGRVPQISVICGARAGGGSYSPALTDFVVMTERASMFLTGPAVVREVMGEDVTRRRPRRPEGPRAQRRRALRRPQRRGRGDARPRPARPPARQHARAAAALALRGARPARPVRGRARATSGASTTCATSSHGLVDGGRMLEWAPRWARNIVCGFARLEGRAVGVIANQPRYLGGVLDADSGSKGARFVRTCNAFGIPLVVLVDTPGFMPGTRQEQGGVIRHGAKLVHAFAEATCPKLTVVLRKAYGGAFIAMNSRDLGADFTLRLARRHDRRHGREAGGRDRQPARDRRRRGPRMAREEFAARYTEEHLSAGIAAAEGYVDEVIAPLDTRRRLIEALNTLDAVAAGRRDPEHPPMTNPKPKPPVVLDAGGRVILDDGSVLIPL